LNRLQKRVDAAKHKYGPNWASRLDTLDLDYKAALLMVKSAKIEGVQYLRYYSDRTTPLELETEFRWLSTRFLHKNVFNHDAYLFEKLSPVNRRFVMYLVSRLTRDDRRRNRRNIARNIAFQDELEQIESARPKRLSGAQ
jgi:hypothetical protein